MNSLYFLAQLIRDGEIKNLNKLEASQVVENGLNITYFIAGIVAVIVIIVAGILYTTSRGEAASVAKAKNLLLYAIVGLVLVVSAFAVTNFVNGNFF